MNYHVRVSGDVLAGCPVIKAEIIEPQMDLRNDPAKAELFDYVCGRAIEIQRARELPLPAIVLIEKQD
jgi:hypothetical protein